MNFYLHEMGEAATVKRLLTWLMTPDVYLIAQAESDARYFREYLPASNVIFLPYCMGPLNGIDPAMVRTGNYVFAGGWTNRDYDLLFRSAANLPEITFVVIASTRSVISEPQPRNVQLLLDVDEASFNRWLAESRLVVIPLKHDVGSSGQMVLLAAMQLGKAAIVPDVGAVADYIDHGVSAIVYAAGSERSLTQAFAAAWHDADLTRRIGQAARMRYRDQFTLSHFNARTVDFIASRLAP